MKQNLINLFTWLRQGLLLLLATIFPVRIIISDKNTGKKDIFMDEKTSIGFLGWCRWEISFVEKIHKKNMFFSHVFFIWEKKKQFFSSVPVCNDEPMSVFTGENARLNWGNFITRRSVDCKFLKYLLVWYVCICIFIGAP